MSVHGWRIACVVELRKAASARVMLGVTVALVGGITVLAIVMNAAARSGREDIVAKLGPIGRLPGWTGYLAAAEQITAAAGVLGFGVALSWLFGREFADGTVTGLFGLPVTRPATALAKLITYAVWALLVASALTLMLVLGGLALGLGTPGSPAWSTLGREWVLIVLSALVATPVGWVSTLSRGVMGGIAATVGLIVTAQVFVLGAQAGGWFPVAAPALWAIAPGTVSGGQLGMVALIPAGFGLATMLAWHRLQLDR